jgi:hypothetical protein
MSVALSVSFVVLGLAAGLGAYYFPNSPDKLYLI